MSSGGDARDSRYGARSGARRGRRATILEEAGLLWADPEMQRAFWQRRNARRGRTAEPVGELAKQFVSGRHLRDATRLSAIRAAWQSVVPAGLQEYCEPLALRGARLTVLVSDASIKYVLEREIGPALLDALRAAGAAARVHDIVFQLGSLRPFGDGPDADPDLAD